MNLSNVLTMINTFDFQEALSYIKAGMTVSLILDGVKRVYNLNQVGEIVCTPNGKEHLTYKVNTFHIDAVMSDDWQLVD